MSIKEEIYKLTIKIQDYEKILQKIKFGEQINTKSTEYNLLENAIRLKIGNIKKKRRKLKRVVIGKLPNKNKAFKLEDMIKD